MPLPASNAAPAETARRGENWEASKGTLYVSFAMLGLVVLLVIIRLIKGGKRAAPTSLDAREYRKFRLVKKTDVNHNTINFRFELPSARHRLGLPVGKHVNVRKPAEGKDDDAISRSYTPVTSDDEVGFFELLIKIYEKGKMGQYLKNLPLKSEVEMRGPQGALAYLGGGHFTINRRETDAKTGGASTVSKDYRVKHVGLIAGGTGLTPMLQIVRDVLKRSNDTTNLSFIFANVTEADILLRAELDGLAERHSNFKVYYTLDKPPQDWKQGTGFVNDTMIAKQIAPANADGGVLVLVCGPPPMCKAQEANLAKLGYTPDQLFIY